ncbi:hypothetical protein PY650_18405 [Rhizobium calliandrae]|uniref:Uncharacterized protein n=1 Tax=Rhizobium calliandrae TaxID=1312182 RepID=A0ABT7KHX3_9HYPH|nr:hypothetical protein [Rhizobium calliandrae]MDL2407600.1 hypothetical protein [Rhizobium calliandrae]
MSLSICTSRIGSPVRLMTMFAANGLADAHEAGMQAVEEEHERRRISTHVS